MLHFKTFNGLKKLFKFRSFRSYEQSYQQEGDYFKKALDNMRVVSGVVVRFFEFFSDNFFTFTFKF